MRVHVVSDVHGASDELARAADGADLFICLGDLLLYLDYADPAQGAFAEVFGPDVAHEYIRLRLAKRFDEARELTAAAWKRINGSNDPAARMERFASIIRDQYATTFSALPEPSLFTFGNVDVPALATPFIRSGQQLLDGQVVDIDGVSFGFVGAGLTSPYRTPNEVSVVDFDAKVAALGQVDVLCTHIPPAIPDLTFDVVARRFEVGSSSILELIEATSPRYALFGHVHQPLASRYRVGRTECLNVGHFRSRGTPFVIDL
ncbi:MAG: metallophosphoesterase family protein [Actinobacteria bacterium]|nr:metallophosphoesterase family protein [Actinomycetota bacterium]